MPYISKNVWCQTHYTQQHHQEERGGIFRGLFFVFSSHLQLKQPLKIPIKTSHTERQLFLCSQRWWENNVFTKLKIRADPRILQRKRVRIEACFHKLPSSSSIRKMHLSRTGKWENWKISALRGQGVPSGVMGNKGVQCLRSQKLHLYERARCPAMFGWPPAARSLLGAPWELLSHYGQITNRVAPGMWNCWE